MLFDDIVFEQPKRNEFSLHIRIPLDMNDELETASRENGLTKNEFIKQLLRIYLNAGQKKEKKGEYRQFVVMPEKEENVS